MNQQTLEEIYERRSVSRWRANELDVVVDVAAGAKILLGDLVLLYKRKAHTPRSFADALLKEISPPRNLDELLAYAANYFFGVALNWSRAGNVKIRTATIFEFPLFGDRLGRNPSGVGLGDLFSFAPDSLEWPTSLREQALRKTNNPLHAIAIVVDSPSAPNAATALVEIRSRIMNRGIGA